MMTARPSLLQAEVDGMPVALAEVNSTYGSEESSDDVHGLDVQVQGLPPSLDFLLVEVGPSRRGRFGPTSIIDTPVCTSGTHSLSPFHPHLLARAPRRPWPGF